mgnify:CR=1 FL=1
MSKRLSLEEARELLKIDKTNLDIQCATHSEIFQDISESRLIAMDIEDTLKTELEEVKARLATEIRVKAAESNEKITEASLMQQVIQKKEYKRKLAELAKAHTEANKWSIMRESFLQRGKMLREVVQLFSDGYFTDISVRSTDTSDGAYIQARNKIKKRYSNK